MKLPSLTRRQLLRTSLLGGAVLSCASAVVYIGARSDADSAGYLPGEWLLLQANDLPPLRAIIPVVLGSRLPDAPEERARLIEDTLHSADSLLFHSSREIHRQSRQVLDLLSFPLYRVMIAGIARPWPRTSEPDIEEFLSRWANSRLELLQNIVNALVRVIQGAWYALPESGTQAGYPGLPKSAQVLLRN